MKPRRHPAGAALLVPFLVWHGLVPPSSRQSNIMRRDNSGVMGVGDVGSCDQDHQTDLRPGPGGPDDAGEGKGGGAQAGSGSEVGEVSVGGDEECVWGGEGREQVVGGSRGPSMMGRNPAARFVETRAVLINPWTLQDMFARGAVLSSLVRRASNSDGSSGAHLLVVPSQDMHLHIHLVFALGLGTPQCDKMLTGNRECCAVSFTFPHFN